jgi:hypothetical protein
MTSNGRKSSRPVERENIVSTPSENIALQLPDADLRVALQGAVSLWASVTTGESERRQDLLRDKRRIVLSFFQHTGKLPGEVEPADVQGWLRDLEEKGVKPGTTYQHACLLSSFYSWALKDGQWVNTSAGIRRGWRALKRRSRTRRRS